MVAVGDAKRYVTNERRDTRQMVVVDVLRLVGHLVVVAMPAGGEERDRDAVSRVLVVVAAAVVLLRVAVGVELVVESERFRLRLVYRLDEVPQLRRQAPRSDQLEIARATTFDVR